MVARVRVKIEGLDRIRSTRHNIFASNHLSYMDTPVVLSHIPCSSVHGEKGAVPDSVLGPHLMQAGHIPVPLRTPRASVKALTLAAKMIRERAISVLFFRKAADPTTVCCSRSRRCCLRPDQGGGGRWCRLHDRDARRAGDASTTFHAGPVTRENRRAHPDNWLALHDRGTVNGSRQGRCRPDAVVQMIPERVPKY